MSWWMSWRWRAVTPTSSRCRRRGWWYPPMGCWAFIVRRVSSLWWMGQWLARVWLFWFAQRCRCLVAWRSPRLLLLLFPSHILDGLLWCLCTSPRCVRGLRLVAMGSWWVRCLKLPGLCNCNTVFCPPTWCFWGTLTPTWQGNRRVSCRSPCWWLRGSRPTRGFACMFSVTLGARRLCRRGASLSCASCWAGTLWC